MDKLTILLTYSDPVWDSVNQEWAFMVDTEEQGIRLISFSDKNTCWALFNDINDSPDGVVMLPEEGTNVEC